MNNSYRLIIHKDLNEAKSEYKEFQEAIKGRAISSSVFWIETWLKHTKNQNNNAIGISRKLLLCFLYKNDNLHAIAPFFLLKRKVGFITLKIIEFATQQWLATYCDIISRGLTKIELDLIFKKLLQTVYKCDLIFLNHIPQFSESFRHTRLFPYSVCPEINLGDFNDYNIYKTKRYSKNLKQNLRTAFNRSAREKKELKAGHQLITDKLFFDITAIARTKLFDNKAFKYATPFKTSFRREIMSVFESNVTAVSIDKTLVAYRTNLFYNDTKFCLDASYDRKYPQYNLGVISVDSSIKNSFKKGCKYHCEGPGLDYYKTKFATDYVKLNYYIRKGNTLLSFILYPIIKYFLARRSRKFLKLTNDY